MPYFFKQMARRRALSLATVVIAFVFAVALCLLSRGQTEMHERIAEVYRTMEVPCSVTNLTGTKSDELDLPDWVINLFFYGITTPGEAPAADSFHSYLQKVAAKMHLNCSRQGATVKLFGITALDAAPELGEIRWTQGYDEQIFYGAEAVCLAPEGTSEQSVCLLLEGQGNEKMSARLTVAGTFDGADFYCPWEFAKNLSLQAQGYLQADSIRAVLADNRRIDEFREKWADIYFVEPSKEGTPVAWDASPAYATYPYALAIYDGTLQATVQKLERNCTLLRAASAALLAAAFAIAAVFNSLTLRSRGKELKLQHILGQGKLLLSALAEQGILSLCGLAMGFGGFALLYGVPRQWWSIPLFWLMSIIGAAVAYGCTMRKRFLEAPLGRDSP